MNGNVAAGNTKLVRNATLMAAACVLFAFILVGIVIRHKKRTDRMSFSFTQRYRSVRERLDAVIVPKDCQKSIIKGDSTWNYLEIIRKGERNPAYRMSHRLL